LGHGTDYLTSPPKEGMLRIFTSEKSDGFGRVWTRELGNQKGKPYVYVAELIQPVFEEFL
jgi:hypothetical protein